MEWQRSSSFQAAQGGGKPPHSTMAGGLVATVLVPPLSFGDLGDGGQQGLGVGVLRGLQDLVSGT